jgi:Phage integrase family/Transposase
MVQLEHPDNLARFADPRGRLLARILMSTGLRVGDGSRLRLDCVVCDGQGAPYLRYTNHKMRRDAFVPIDTDLAEAIAAQQQTVADEFDDPVFLLPRPTRNPDGKLAFSAATFRGELREWLRVCDIRDELGREVHVTPHQWRHTFGTCLINNEVPQETVRRLLDHDSHAMTSHYARLSDKTIREQWERARKVNGVLLSSNDFPATAAGYRALLAWAGMFGMLRRAGVECTGFYGAALARYLRAAGVEVIEVNAPDKASRRRQGKTDPVDAQAAARAVLSGWASATAKAGDGPVEDAAGCSSWPRPLRSRPAPRPSTNSKPSSWQPTQPCARRCRA